MSTTPAEPPPDAATGTAGEDVLADAAAVIEDAVERELGAEPEATMDALDAPRRLLLVHAHPDDESITTGATIARYAGAAGTRVTLVTCTRGEQGEVIGAEHAALEGDGDALADHRTAELAAAAEALGLADHRFLGADAGARYRDSGMVWGDDGRATAAPDAAVGAFTSVAVDAAAAHLVRVLREVRPQVVVTYGADGGYGHPDHVQAHRVTHRAVAQAAAPGGGGEPWQVAKVYEVTGDAAGATAVVAAEDQLPAKAAALRAHATQVVVHGDTFELSNGVPHPLTGTEHFVLAAGVPAPAADREDGRESDLFAGVA